MGYVIVFLIVFGAYWLEAISPALFALGKPDHSAEMRLEPEGATISVALNVSSPIGKAEYYRRLTLKNSVGKVVSRDLTPDNGGFPSLNLYRREDGKVVIASPIDGIFLLDFETLSATWYNHRPSRTGAAQKCERFRPAEGGRIREGLPESKYVPGFFYVGRFDFRQRGVWVFVPATERAEMLRETGAGDFWESPCP